MTSVTIKCKARQLLPGIIGDQRAILVCSERAFGWAAKDEFLAPLIEKSNLEVATEFSSNPTITEVESLRRQYSDFRPQLIVGLGGGSAMDTAKILRATLSSKIKNESLAKIIATPELLNGLNLPNLIQLPTTAGTGSEATHFATIWDPIAQKKYSLAHKALVAGEVIVDPDFLIDTPKEVVLSCGLDAINQAFESLWNVNSTPETAAIARKSLTLSLPALKKLMEDPNDYLREHMAYASYLAGCAIDITKTSICHSMSYPVTLATNLPHGLACGFTMLEVFEVAKATIKEDVFEINRGLAPNDIAHYMSELLHSSSYKNLIRYYITSADQIYGLLDQMNTPERLGNFPFAVSEVDLKRILKGSLRNVGIE